MKKYKAVIYDLDGLLIDSMLYWIKADQTFLGKYDIELTEQMIQFLTGKSEVENMEWLKKEFNIDDSTESMLHNRRAITDLIYTKQTMPMPGAEDLLKILDKTELKQSIASGVSKYCIDEVCDRFDWHNHFESLISSEHVGNKGKPNPAVYTYTAKKMNIDPRDCVVLEDAVNGVIAAKRAGMDCIAVPNEKWSFGDFSEADLIVDSLNDKNIYNYLNL